MHHVDCDTADSSVHASITHMAIIKPAVVDLSLLFLYMKRNSQGITLNRAVNRGLGYYEKLVIFDQYFAIR